MSSELDVIEEDRDRAGVAVGVAPRVRARASASETAERYEAAVDKPEDDAFFLPNMDCVGVDELKAMGDGLDGILGTDHDGDEDVDEKGGRRVGMRAEGGGGWINLFGNPGF